MLTTQRTLLTVQESLASVEAEIAQGYIDLYTALGGGWTVLRSLKIMTDKTNTTKAQKTDIEGLLGADKVKLLYERGSFWLVLLILLGILFAVYYFFFRGSQGQVGFVTSL